MTEQELEAISARAAAATPGPWLMEYADGADDRPLVWVTTPDDDAEFSIGQVHYVTHQTQYDGQFIADARTDVPALVAALREANAKIARMQEWVHTMKHYGCNHDTKSASKDCRETADFFWEGDRVRGFFDELDVALNGSKGA